MNHDDYIKDLRRSYILASPAQRLSVAKQRIENPEHGPNLLVVHVSAIEGFVRSLVTHQLASTREELLEIYPTFCRSGPKELITAYLRDKCGTDPIDFFGAEDWELFGYAVGYRNLLAHEATYLGQDRYPEIISVCERVLDRLLEIEGL